MKKIIILKEVDVGNRIEAPALVYSKIITAADICIGIYYP